MSNKSNPLAKITLIWVLTGVLLFIVLILLGIFMRVEQGNMLQSLQPYFYSVMTLHGMGMAGLWYIGSMSIVVYVATKYINPSKGVQYLAYVTTLIGVVMLIVSTLIGKFAAGWYFLYPLPFHGSWPNWSMHLFFASIAVLVVGWLIWSLDYLRAVSKKYKLNQALGWHYIAGKEAPVVPPFITITTVSVIACLACLVSGIAVILLFYIELFSGVHNDALMMKNLTFFFGHLIVNLSMYLGVGVVYDTLPKYTEREWGNNRIVSIAWNCVLILILAAYFHHLYMDFAQPLWMQYAGQIASYTSSLPSAVVTIFGGLALVYRAKMKWNLTSAFMFLGMMGWAIGGIGALIDSTIAVNSRFHNTLWVPAHFHTYMIEGLVIMVLGYFYHFVHEVVGKEQNAFKSKLILGLYLFGGYGFLAMFYLGGAASIPRRYSAYNWDIIHSGVLYAQLAVVFATILLIGVLFYFFELFRNWKLAYKEVSAAENS